MSEAELHAWMLVAYFGLALITWVVLTFITAPYGRHNHGGWGPTVPAKLGWVLMETPAVGVYALVHFMGDHSLELAPLGLLLLWQVHYIHRTFIYPLRISASSKRMPLLIVGIAASYQVFNSYVVARWVSHLHAYPTDWVTDPRFLLGVSIFVVGMVINVRADNVLIGLRKAKGSGYSVPRGGLYERICCPNYLGEILEWVGFAIASWSLAGLAFALYTVANLLPRALANLAWYREKFPDYPPERKALIPWVL